MEAGTCVQYMRHTCENMAHSPSLVICMMICDYSYDYLRSNRSGPRHMATSVVAGVVNDARRHVKGPRFTEGKYRGHGQRTRMGVSALWLAPGELPVEAQFTELQQGARGASLVTNSRPR
jgi:hypothetical protein